MRRSLRTGAAIALCRRYLIRLRKFSIKVVNDIKAKLAAEYKFKNLLLTISARQFLAIGMTSESVDCFTVSLG